MLDDGFGLVRRKQHRRTAGERAAIVAETYEPGVLTSAADTIKRIKDAKIIR
jgi:hypothetical protein